MSYEKLNWQVTSLELSKKLKELGVQQNSRYKWSENANYVSPCGGTGHYEYTWTLNSGRTDRGECAAFSVAELGELIAEAAEQDFPGEKEWRCGYPYTYKRSDGKWWCIVRPYPKGFVGHLDIEKHTESETEADARAKMLIYLIENKLICVK